MTALEDAAGSYRRLLRVPVLRGLAVADVCARLPQGMVTVTLLLVAAVHASMITAGLVVTGYTLGLASSAVPGGGGTEAQAWLNSAMNGGAAAGAALAGATASRPVLSLAITAGVAAVAAASCAGRPRAGPRHRVAS